MSEDRYRSGSQQTVLAAIEALAERPLAGLDPSELARRIGCSRDQAYRALKNLALAGWATEPTEGFPKWRVGTRATQLSERMRLAIADLHRQYLGDLG